MLKLLLLFNLLFLDQYDTLIIVIIVKSRLSSENISFENSDTAHTAWILRRED